MSDDRDHDAIEGELVQATETAQRMPHDIALLKMENESIMAVARAAPRSPAKIIKELKAVIEAYPAAADEAIYSKPVGSVISIQCGTCGQRYEVSYIPRDGVDCPKCQSNEIGSQRRVKKYAEGLSIRAAESIRSVFGYNRLATSVEQLPDGCVKLTGIFVDYAAGNITADERIVSPFYKKARSNVMERIPEDRFLNVVVKAEKAKLRRDIILDSVPNIVKAAYRDECEKKLAQVLDDNAIKKIGDQFHHQYGLNSEQLEQIVGRPLSMGWTEEDRMRLLHIWNALKNEETTVRELLEDTSEREPADDKKVSRSELNNQIDEAAKQPKEEKKPAGKKAKEPTPPKEEPKTEAASEQQEETPRKQGPVGEAMDILARAAQPKDVDYCENYFFGEKSKVALEDEEAGAIRDAIDSKRKELESRKAKRDQQKTLGE